MSNLNSDGDYHDRLMAEIMQIRCDLKSKIEIQERQIAELKKAGGDVQDINYQILLVQIANTTNIDYLFQMLRLKTMKK